MVSAVVSDCNVFFLRIYDKDTLVLERDGCVNGSQAEVRIPISSPIFGGGKVYKAVFHAGLLNHPVFGVNVFSSSVTAFKVVNGSSRLMLETSYDNKGHELRSRVRLTGEESERLANKTVDFYLLPNSELQRCDRGWVYVGSRKTDEGGATLLCLGVNMKSGNYSLEARFGGDIDFGSSSNVTCFVSEAEASYLRFVKVERLADKIVVTLRIVDKYDFPLAGRLFSFDFLGIQRDSLSAISNETGHVVVSFEADSALSSIDSRLRILGDEYTSSLQTVARLNLAGTPSFSELSKNRNDLERSDEKADFADRVKSAANGASGIEVLGLKNVVVSATPNPAGADLPVTVKAKFSSYDGLYEGAKFCFYLNGTVLKGTVTASVETVLVHYPDVYRYDHTAELIWQPDYWGNYTFLVKLLDAYNTVVAQGITSFEVHPAPANMVVYYPEAFRGDSLNLTIAFSGPRTYEAPNESDFFQISRLAPLIAWDGVTYVLDGGANATPIHVFVNGSRIVDVLSSSETVSNALLPLNFSGNYVTMNIRVATDDLSRYHEVFERNCTLTRANVLNKPSGGNDLLKLNYSLGDLNENNRTCICSDNLIEASASIFGLPLDSVTTTFIGGKIEIRSATNTSGWVSIPQGFGLLRVKSACCLRDEMASPLADVNLDGIVDDVDFNETNNRMRSVFGNWLYDWRFDLNADGRINETDTDIINCSLGRQVEYLDSGSYDYNSTIVDFDNGIRGSLDSQGFTTIPSEARWLNMSIGGIVEFFDFTLWKHCGTNNIGVASTRWCPQQAGLYVLQVNLPLSFDVVMELQSNVTHLDASLSLVNYVYVVKRPLDLNVTYAPGEPTMDSLITFTARLLDLGLGAPVRSRCLEFYIKGTYDILMGTAYTNASGFATFSCVPRDYEDPQNPFFLNIAFPVVCPEAAETKKTVGYVQVDMRTRTKLEFLGSEVMDLRVGQPYTFTFRLTTVDGIPIIGMYVNFTKDNEPPNQMQTIDDGLAYRLEFYSEPGTHSYWARLDNSGVNYAPSNEVKFVAVVQVVPVSILLDVQPRNFKPAAELTLSATVLRTTSNEPLQDIAVTFNQIEADGSLSVIGDVPTNASGVASKLFFYPLAGVYAFNVSVAGCQQFICSPVMLTVAKETVLTLEVTKGAKDTNHTISGMLSSYSQPVPNKQVSILVNGTVKSIVTTSINGWYNLSLDFLPADNKPTTYSVQASFEGDEPSSAAAYGYTPNGTQYAVCTATHYGYKPTSKSTMLTVESRSTTTTTITKTPEQVQVDAIQIGCLRIWNEFTLWYPWYRLHVNVTLGEVSFDVGFNPVLPFGTTFSISGLDTLASVLNCITEEIWQDTAVDLFGLFTSFIAAKTLSLCGEIPGLVAIGAKGVVQWALFAPLLLNEKAGSVRMVAAFIANTLMGFVALSAGIGEAFAEVIWKVCTAPLVSMFMYMARGAIAVAAPLEWIRTRVDYIESCVVDFPIAIIALARYSGWI